MCRLFLVSTALLLILFGSAGLLMVPKIIQQKIEQRLQLKIGTKSFERFTRVPIPLTVKFYIFNITNSEQVLQGLERPKFEQVGPFMYKQWRRRDILDLIDHNRRIVYKEIKTYYPMFDSSSSKTTNSTFSHTNVIHSTHTQTSTTRQQSMQTHNLMNENGDANITQPIEYLDPHDFNVTIVNVPLLSVLTQLANINKGLKLKLAKKVVTNLIKGGKEKILISRRASELLFDGYKVALMETAEDLISKTLGFNFESPLKQNMFGFFYAKNNTWTRDQSGEMTVFTGRNESMNDFMLVDNWNGMKRLKVWPTNTVAGDRCNRIKGTDGSQFHPGLDKQQPLSIFSPMICTSIEVFYRSDTSAKGIPLYRYSTGPSAFAAPKKNAQNACYCTIPDPPDDSASGRSTQTTSASMSMSNSMTASATSTTINPTATSAIAKRSAINQSRCYLDGIIDLSLCQKGAPIAASSPHFYQADPMLAMATGLEPDPVQHQTYLDIEPMTGAVMRAASRAQLNAFVEQAALDMVEPELIGHMAPMIAPLLWLEESAEIDDKSANEFKQQLLRPVKKFRCICMAAIIIGVLVIIATTVHFVYFTCLPCGPSSSDKQTITKRPPGRRGRYERASAGRSREHWAGGGSGSSADRAKRRSQLDANLRLATSANDTATGAKVRPDQEGRPRKQPSRIERRSRRADYEDDDDDDTGGLFSEDDTDLVHSDSGSSSKRALVRSAHGTGASCSSASCYDQSPGVATRAKQRRPDQQNDGDGDNDEDNDERRDLIKGQATSDRGPVTSAL